MKELKILAVLAVVVIITYIGIEPYAKHVMHGTIPPPDFSYLDLPKFKVAGDPSKGRELFKANCASCHSLKADGIEAGMDKKTAELSFHVVPPDLSNIAAIVEEHFLANFIRDPQNATKNPKFAMPPMGYLTNDQIGDIIAYLKSTAKKELTGEEILHDACTRCHSVKYQKIPVLTSPEHLKTYLGKIPPDLSLMGRAKEHEYLITFINNPQVLLPGTTMPRLGLTQEATEKVVAYLEQIADPYKEQRKKIGMWVLIYMLIGVVITYAWKKKIWKNIH